MKKKIKYLIYIGLLLFVILSLNIKNNKSKDNTKRQQYYSKITKDNKNSYDLERIYANGTILNAEKLLPTSPNNYKEYNHNYFILGYADKHKQAAWVCWLLTKDRVNNRRTKRLNNFREDSSLTCQGSTLKDYKKSGYVRGHIYPSADMLWSRKANSETFLLSNISPQTKELNDGRWNDLENATRKWVIKNDSLLVIAGPIFNKPLDYIGKNKVTVPNQYYKIIIDISYPRYKAIAFIMPNKNIKNKMFKYATTIKDIEKQTGLNFFPKYDNDTLIQKLETMCDTNMWKK